MHIILYIIQKVRARVQKRAGQKDKPALLMTDQGRGVGLSICNADVSLVHVCPSSNIPILMFLILDSSVNAFAPDLYTVVFIMQMFGCLM